MSRMLDQRKPAEPAAPKHRRSPSLSSAPTVAGVPLLLRLPDLRAVAKSKSVADRKEPLAASSTTAGVSSGDHDVANHATPRDQGASAPTESQRPDAGANRVSAKGWRNSLWHLLIPIGLLGLFLGAWAMISAPADDDDSSSTGDNRIVSPDIEGGVLISPGDLITTEGDEPAPLQPSAAGSLTEFTPNFEIRLDGSSPAESGAGSGPELNIANRDSAPPELVNRQEGASPNSSSVPPSHGGRPHEAGQSKADSAAAAEESPASQTAEQAPSYPTTDPTTYQYPRADGMPRVGQRQENTTFQYPTTGAPTPYSPGGAPGADRR